MKDPIGPVVLRLRSGLASDGGTWPVTVRGGRRWEGGDSIPLVIVRSNSRSRDRTDAARWRLVVTSYAEDPRTAMLLDDRVSDVLHGTTWATIYRSGEEVGGQPGEDPDTGWSFVTSVYTVYASTANP